MPLYRVTLFNQHARCGIFAEGRTRPEAFKLALVKAGEPFLRYGGDKLTTMRVLFFDHLMKRYRTSSHAYSNYQNGAAVEFRRIS